MNKDELKDRINDIIPSNDAVADVVTDKLQEVISKSNDNTEHEGTWSYYTNEETFVKFLGQTSYYQTLQRNLSKIVKIIEPKRMLELGFGTGHTSVRVAKENPQSRVTAIDLRKNMVAVGKELAKRMDVSVDFSQGDMMKYVEQDMSDFDFIFLLYNFHHIPDETISGRRRESKKENFLRNCYNNMRSGTYLCIADLFVSDETLDVIALFENRVQEGYSSTFWNRLISLDAEAISEAKRVADYCKRNEEQVGIKVQQRKLEYPISRTWLENAAKNIGFKKIISEEVDIVGDAVLLFEKAFI
jgi:SAM-dependent methyltransferase